MPIQIVRSHIPSFSTRYSFSITIDCLVFLTCLRQSLQRNCQSLDRAPLPSSLTLLSSRLISPPKCNAISQIHQRLPSNSHAVYSNCELPSWCCPVDLCCGLKCSSSVLPWDGGTATQHTHARQRATGVGCPLKAQPAAFPLLLYPIHWYITCQKSPQTTRDQ